MPVIGHLAGHKTLYPGNHDRDKHQILRRQAGKKPAQGRGPLGRGVPQVVGFVYHHHGVLAGLKQNACPDPSGLNR